ncbi:HopJ type III effector protein [Sulfuriflexus sp.]|uniref:HopJ type III effector protein n=1 Tax=Sulfuriflexus sp. TaxID=2015443 RepID=UPI0028CBDD1C|nr:HopJ type III effector protein [Sulfuriflexus sp.]MDT8404936.1 HopJ type III effector protein [Sulfuriflexus sp.]
MNVIELIDKVRSAPAAVEFNEVMDCIAENYAYTPTRFTNGSGEDAAINETGTNEGSCKIFAFARLNKLNEAETLACFGKYYREDVLLHPEHTDHANIRNFMRHGWGGVHFDGPALSKR